jgi:hypothetical protein
VVRVWKKEVTNWYLLSKYRQKREGSHRDMVIGKLLENKVSAGGDGSFSKLALALSLYTPH